MNQLLPPGACPTAFRPAGNVSSETSSKLWAGVAMALLIGFAWTSRPETTGERTRRRR
jgi:hypothetical protein